MAPRCRMGKRSFGSNRPSRARCSASERSVLRRLRAISATCLGLATMTSCPSSENIRLSHGDRGPTSSTTRASCSGRERPGERRGRGADSLLPDDLPVVPEDAEVAVAVAHVDTDGHEPRVPPPSCSLRLLYPVPWSVSYLAKARLSRSWPTYVRPSSWGEVSPLRRGPTLMPSGWTPRLPRAAGRRPGRRRGDRCRGRAGCLSGAAPAP